jgi:hypothetical protein
MWRLIKLFTRCLPAGNLAQTRGFSSWIHRCTCAKIPAGRQRNSIISMGKALLMDNPKQSRNNLKNALTSFPREVKPHS